MASTEEWPDLTAPGWQDTVTTLHMWTQIVGKTRLALCPMQNHWWQVALYVTPRGLDTSIINDGDRSFTIDLDLVDHVLCIVDSRGHTPSFPLAGLSVADFYRRFLETLRSIGVDVQMLARPVEVERAVRFESDEQCAYDATWVRRFHQVLVKADAILKDFRGGFVGKASPVHFFWGGFDLAVTRFSGRRAPTHPGGVPNVANRVMHEAYSHEVSSAGFWPGSPQLPEPAFYAYAYPEPEGFSAARVQPEAARYDTTLREFILPYSAVRSSRDPRGDVRAFLQTTYAAAADRGGWDRKALER